MFKEENTLPGAELQLAVGDRDHFARARQRHPNMRGAVVRTFIIVFVVRVFRHQLLEEALEIATRGRGRVFHNDEAAARVLDEHRRGAGPDAALLDCRLHLLRYLVGAFAVGPHFKAACLGMHSVARQYGWLLRIAIFAVAIGDACALSESEIAPLYKRAVAGDKTATEQCIALLESAVKEQPDNRIAQVYLGSAYALRSRDLSFGFAKLSTFRRGMAIMDSAVAAAPENPRVRLVRALTCDPLPAFLGRRQTARDDFARLAELAKQSPDKFTAGELKIVREHSRSRLDN